MFLTSPFIDQALAQLCAFYSPEVGILSAMEIYRQSSTRSALRCLAIASVLQPRTHIQINVTPRKMRWSNPARCMSPNRSRAKKEMMAGNERSTAETHTDRHLLSQRRGTDSSGRARVAQGNAIIPISLWMWPFQVAGDSWRSLG